ncbi:MAG: leucyl/phenylalanyl-tRNA--protein transferase, partial [Bacteroidota bacterium]
ITPRPTQDGTWITDRFVEGYSNLHKQGIAHSIEVWNEDRLVGGLYGLSVGKMFCGESMFALENNASKAGFITLVRALEKSSFWLVDCQVGTQHLESLGARGISRDKYLELLGQNTYNRTLMGKWRL